MITIIWACGRNVFRVETDRIEGIEGIEKSVQLMLYL